MTSIYLLRHGSTSANRELPYRLQGRGSDHPLDGLGLEQAHQASSALAGLEFSAVYASPLLRSLQTARIVAAPHGLLPTVIPELVEASLGRWEGLTWDEVRQREPELFQQFMNHPGTVSYPGGESFLNVLHRVQPVFTGLAARHVDQTIAVVGHNVLNRAYLSAILGLSIDQARSIRQANGAFNLIRFEGDKPTLFTLNACLHLREVVT